MTSANVIEYRVFKDSVFVGKHRENLLCRGRLDSLLKFKPYELHQLEVHWLDENEADHVLKRANLKEFLIEHRPIHYHNWGEDNAAWQGV